MTRAKDISKIVTDADLSGTLDVTGVVTVGGLKLGHQNYISWTDGGGTNRNVIQFDTDTLKIGISGNVDNTIIRSNGADRIKVDSIGDISFYEDTGTTAKLFWDASAERLGIGTTSPATPIHTYSTSLAINRFEVGSNTDSGIRVMNTTGDYSIYTAGGSLRFADNNDSEIMRFSSGNVGIGTSSPNAKLQVDGTFTVRSSSSQIFNDSSNANNLTMNDSKAHFNFDGVDKDFQVSSDTVTHALFVQGSDGNVGIGTSSPNEKLTVSSGAISFLGDISTPSIGVGLFRPANNTLAVVTSSTERMRIHSGGQLSLATTDATHGFNVGQSGTDFRGRFQGSNQYRLGLQNGTSNLVWLGSGGANNFRISNSSGQTRFEIDSDARATFTSTSNNTLSSGTGVVNVNLEQTRQTNKGPFIGFRVPNHADITTNEDMGAIGFVAPDSTTGSRKADFVVYTRNTTFGEKMRITHDGEMGLGVTNPSQKLDVRGTVHLGVSGLNSGDVTGTLSIGNTGTNYMTFIKAINTNSTPGILRTRMGFFTLSGVGEEAQHATEKMSILADSGNVGIGTTTPSQKLDVNGTIIASTTASQGARIERNGATGGANFDSVLSSGSLHFRTGTTERMRLNSTTLQINQNTQSRARVDIISNLAAYTHIHLQNDTNNTGGVFIAFQNHAGTTIGSISQSGTSTAYNTSSDYRLKENVSYDFDATTRLKQLRPARFNFIADADTTVDGFLAHEVQSVVPEAVSGTKDATQPIGNITDADGNILEENVKEPFETVDGQTWTTTGTEPVYQGIDQSKLVPLLVKTIQELEARITALEGA